MFGLKGLLTFCCFILFTFSFSDVIAQPNEKELRSMLDTSSGGEKIMILNRLSDAVLYKSPQQSLKYGIEALNLARKDSSLYLLSQSYVSIGYALRYLGEYQRALDSLYITINFINKLKDKRLQSQILNLIGLVHQELGHDTLSLDHYIKSLDIAEKEKDYYGMISTLNNLGNFYMNSGNYKKSSEYYFKCLKIYEELKNEKGIAQMYNNIGTVYQKQGNYEKALNYHKKAFEIIQKYPDYKIGLAYVYTNLGACYINLKEYNKASDYLIKSITICKDLGLYENLLANYINLGIVFKEQQNFSQAISYLKEGMALADKTDNELSKSKYLLNIADVYITEKNYYQALNYLKKALPYTRKLNDYFLLSENNYGIYEVYKALGYYGKSLNYLEKYLEYRDSLDVINNTKLVSEIEAQYELDKKEQRINTLRKDSRIQELELDKKNTNNKLLIIGISALGLIIALILYLFLQRIRLNKILKEQNRQINEQNEELNIINHKLILSEKELKKSNKTKDKFFSIIAHDLKNPLIALKSMVFSFNKNKDEITTQQFSNFINQLDQSLNSVIELLNNLLNWGKTQKGQIKFIPEKVSLSEIVKKCIISLEKQASNKNIVIDNKIISKDLFIITDKNMLEFIIRNILSNSIKFSHKESQVLLDYSLNNDQLSIKIQDQGTGISKDNIEKIMNNGSLQSTVGTENEKGTGLGLMLCKDFLKKMNGQLQIESVENKGSTFYVILPLK